MNKISKKQKIVLFTILSVVLFIMITAIILFATFESRVEGTWVSERYYSEKYNQHFNTIIVSFEGDGLYTNIVIDSNGKILDSFQAYSWETRLRGFQVYGAKEKTGARVGYTFNPITGALTSGDRKYVKK